MAEWIRCATYNPKFPNSNPTREIYITNRPKQIKLKLKRTAKQEFLIFSIYIFPIFLNKHSLFKLTTLNRISRLIGTD